MIIPGVIESRRTFHPEFHLSAYHLDPADQLVAALAVHGGVDRHVVRDLRDPFGCEEAGDKDVGVRPVELFAGDALRNRGDLEASTLLVVEDGREDARGVEVRHAQPVDRPIHPYQGRRVQVADDPVVLYRLVGHSIFSLPTRTVCIEMASSGTTSEPQAEQWNTPSGRQRISGWPHSQECLPTASGRAAICSRVRSTAPSKAWPQELHSTRSSP